MEIVLAPARPPHASRVQTVRATDPNPERWLGVSELTRKATLFGGGLTLDLWIPLTDRFWLEIGGAGTAWRTPLWDGRASVQVLPEARVGLSWTF